MFQNHNAAFDWFKRFIETKGYKVKMVTPVNKGRHLMIETSDECGKFHYFYCLFKHADLHSFNYLFPDFIKSYSAFAGHGESINVEWCEYARRREATLVYIYPDMKTYIVDAYYINTFCSEHKLIREQDRKNEYKLEFGNGETQIIREKEFIFPISLLRRFN